MNNKGFTLVEIIVVLVIMAILAAVAVPSVLSYINDANEARYIAEARTIYLDIQVEEMKYLAGSKHASIAAAYRDDSTSTTNDIVVAINSNVIETGLVVNRLEYIEEARTLGNVTMSKSSYLFTYSNDEGVTKNILVEPNNQIMVLDDVQVVASNINKVVALDIFIAKKEKDPDKRIKAYSKYLQNNLQKEENGGYPILTSGEAGLIGADETMYWVPMVSNDLTDVFFVASSQSDIVKRVDSNLISINGSYYRYYDNDVDDGTQEVIHDGMIYDQLVNLGDNNDQYISGNGFWKKVI